MNLSGGCLRTHLSPVPRPHAGIHACTRTRRRPLRHRSGLMEHLWRGGLDRCILLRASSSHHHRAADPDTPTEPTRESDSPGERVWNGSQIGTQLERVLGHLMRIHRRKAMGRQEHPVEMTTDLTAGSSRNWGLTHQQDPRIVLLRTKQGERTGSSPAGTGDTTSLRKPKPRP